MRNEILEAINYARAKADERRQRVQNMVGEYPFGRPQSDEDQGNLDRRSQYLLQLLACTKIFSALIDVYGSTASSITIEWDNSQTQHNITVELTLYGPLAAIFVYGSPPDGLFEYVENCLKSIGLISLTKEEIKELEEGPYLELFE